MPTPVREVLTGHQHEIASFSLEPAMNAAHSLLLVHRADQFSGLGEWVSRTVREMSAEERQRNDLVMEGFYYLATPKRSWSSFPAFVDSLAGRDAVEMRDELLTTYEMVGKDLQGEKASMPAASEALGSADQYVDFLCQRFQEQHVNETLERQAYEYVVQPERMQELIVSHLRSMWDTYLVEEWERVRPMLQDSVDAFRQVDFSEMDYQAIIEFVTGDRLEKDHWVNKLEEVERIVFVPSAHVGPYMGNYFANDTLWVMFGARIPEGVEMDAPDLSRAELVVRLGALADDDRLRILRRVADRGEMKSPEIIDELGFSQSAASRHLKQLSATGFLSERRCNGAKCYALNPARVRDTADGLANFLLATAS